MLNTLVIGEVEPYLAYDMVHCLGCLRHAPEGARSRMATLLNCLQNGSDNQVAAAAFAMFSELPGSCRIVTATVGEVKVLANDDGKTLLTLKWQGSLQIQLYRHPEEDSVLHNPSSLLGSLFISAYSMLSVLLFVGLARRHVCINGVTLSVGKALAVMALQSSGDDYEVAMLWDQVQ